MDGNPYVRMVDLMRTQPERTPCHLRLGRVSSAFPLAVNAAGLPLPAAALGVNAQTAAGARRRVRLTVPGQDPVEAELELLDPELRPGDQVLLLTEDDQQFYILMKAAGAT